jgi:hypothetical protein
MTAATAAWVIPLFGVATSAVGVGISAYGQHKAAKQSAQIAQYNYAMQQQQARQQQQLALFQQQQMNQQASVMEQQALINNALAQSSVQAQLNNAAALRQSAEAQTAADRENFRATQRDNERLKALQRARLAKSGTVTSAGSPLEFLVEQEGEMQQALNEQHYQSNIGRQKTYGEAALADFSAKMEGAGAQAQLSASRAEAGFMKVAAQLEAAKGAAAASQQQRQARLNLMGGLADARGQRLASWGSLLSGIGSLGSQWTSWNYMGGKAGSTTLFAPKAAKATGYASGSW